MVVTRPPSRAEALTSRLRDLGAAVLECPTIRLEEPLDPRPLEDAVRRLEAYDWLVFTSPAGVRRLAAACARERGDPAGVAPDLSVAAIGPSTAEAARRKGWRVDVVPGEYRAEALLAELRRRARGGREPGEPGGRDPGVGPEVLTGLRFLLPRAAEARDVLPEGLAASGAEVDVVTAYRAVAPEAGSAERVAEAIRGGEVDWLTFTASSTVRNFVELVGTEVGGARVAVIGPVTAETARELGLGVDAVAEVYTVSGLVDALVRAAAGPRETVP